MAAAVPAIAAIGKFGATLLAGASKAAPLVAATGATVGAVAALKGPKMPDMPGVVPMPDELALEAARRRKLAAEQTRIGQASTLLGGGAGGTLG